MNVASFLISQSIKIDIVSSIDLPLFLSHAFVRAPIMAHGSPTIPRFSRENGALAPRKVCSQYWTFRFFLKSMLIRKPRFFRG